MARETSSMNFFFFNDTATTEIYTLSLHDALPILHRRLARRPFRGCHLEVDALVVLRVQHRSEEHTSELQSQSNLVCRLLLEKKKTVIVGFLATDCAIPKVLRVSQHRLTTLSSNLL